MEGKTDGFKFAVTALTGLLAFLFFIIKYFQDNVVDPDLKLDSHILFNNIILSSIGLILYIFLKGLAMEVQDTNKKTLDEYATVFYITAFYISIVSVINLYTLKNLYPINNRFYIYAVMLIILATAVYFTQILSTKLLIPQHSLPFKKRRNLIYPQYNNWLVAKCDTWIVPIIMKIPVIFILKIFIFLLFVYLGANATFGTFQNPPANWIKGDIIIDTKDMYYKNDAPIPVSIRVTGMNENLSINLLRVSPEHNPTLMDYIILEPKYNLTKAVISGNNSILIGNSLNYGKYIVFINTTDLTTGYYELVGLRYSDEEYVKSFYLLNNTKI